MGRLDKPKRKGFSQADFDLYPVWVWDDEMESHQPVEEVEPSIEDYGTLFIKARFEVGGNMVDGYLVGGSSFYAFGLFIAGREFVMNLNLPDMIEKDLAEICRLLKCEPFKLFPLRFVSPVCFRGGRPVKGVLFA